MMKNKTRNAKVAEQEWWHTKGTDDERQIYKDVALKYLEDHGQDPRDVDEFSALCKFILPLIAQKVQKWQDFQTKFFMTNSYTAHKDLYDTVYNAIDAVAKEMEEKDEEEQEA